MTQGEGITIIIVLAAFVVSAAVRLYRNKTRLKKLAKAVSERGQLPDSKFYANEDKLTGGNNSRTTELLDMVKGRDALLEIRNTGIYFNVIFLEPYNYKKALQNNEPFMFIPWTEMKSIRESSPPAFGHRKMARDREEMSAICLLIKLKPGTPTFNKLGRQVFITISVIDNYVDAEFLIRRYAAKNTKCKL